MEIDARAWGIPELDVALQPKRVAGDWTTWGQVAADRQVSGWVHCYARVGTCARLFRDPDLVLLSGCAGVVEPPQPSGPGVSRAESLFGIQRKRSLAARWQALGLGVLVDLSADDRDLDLALLGVPQGWRGYAVRTPRAPAGWVAARYALARARAAPAWPVLVVVGGGKGTRAECRRRGWRYVAPRGEARFAPRAGDAGWTPDDARAIMEAANNPVPDETKWTLNG